MVKAKSVDALVLDLQKLAIKSLSECIKHPEDIRFTSEANAYLDSLTLVNKNFGLFLKYSNSALVLESYIDAPEISLPIKVGEYYKKPVYPVRPLD